MAKKRITLAQFYAAMEADAITKTQGTLVERDPATGAITGACAYGQAALHLGVNENELYRTLQDWGYANHIQPLIDLVGTNDRTDSTIPAIARWYRSQTPTWALHQTFDIEAKY